MKDRIRIKGARQHNLKGFDVEIPRRAITVITGPSGSGKSSLAFDTIYAEGQRRYVESLSAYARQFLERMEKPNVEYIEGLSPAVSIEQKNPTKTSRSTVGTATEIYDYLRLLWARIGVTVCPVCGRELRPDTVQSVSDTIRKLPSGTRFSIGFPLHASEKVTHEVLVENLQAQGFIRLSVDGDIYTLDQLEAAKIDLTKASELIVVVDRLTNSASTVGRLADAIATSFAEGEGEAIAIFPNAVESPLNGSLVESLRFTERYECPNDGTKAPVPTPQLFSFNNPRGACEECNGFGATLEYDESLVIPYPERSLRDGAIDPWTKPRYESKRRLLAEFARKHGIPMDTAWSDLDESDKRLLLHTEAKRGYMGIFPFLKALEEKRYKQYIRVFLRQYQAAHLCPRCNGSKLQPAALDVKVQGMSIADVSLMPIDALSVWLANLSLTEYDFQIAEPILRETTSRVSFLCDVGLTYLSLHRATRTLSGGEAQRIGLANSLGARLVDTLYVLDEPSIGLHPRDMDRLLSLLKRLRDHGNTVIIVEHDPAAIEIADYMIELGPESGVNGGDLVFADTMDNVENSPLTGQYLTGARSIEMPEKRRTPKGGWLSLTGAREHNLKGVDIRIPLGTLTVVTGVSGSGKSTLIHDVLYHALETKLSGEHSAKRHLGEAVGRYDTISGYQGLEEVVLIDQSPIGKSPRSNPVTYVKAFDEIRKIFADTPLARQRKYTPGTFSFNVAGGRCDKCDGAGYLEVEMVFMADVFVECEECGGKRFKPQVLEVKVNNKSIADVLHLTVDQAIRFFHKQEKLGQALWHLQQVGLGYLQLGQPSNTLSGGEAQRIKIARELSDAQKKKGKKMYIMDEPTTGLHLDDIRKLVSVLDKLVNGGHTLLLIEHNLDVIKLADWIIDVGPEGGEDGGRIVGSGTPEEIVNIKESYTGQWLKGVLN